MPASYSAEISSKFPCPSQKSSGETNTVNFNKFLFVYKKNYKQNLLLRFLLRKNARLFTLKQTTFESEKEINSDYIQ